jgi:hypothetical protein
MATDHAGAWNDVFPEWDYRFQETGVPIVNKGTGGQNLGQAGIITYQAGGLGAGPTSTTYCVSYGTSGLFEYDASNSIPTYTATQGAVGLIFKGPTADGVSDKELIELLDNTSPFPRLQLKQTKTGNANANYDNMLFFRLSDGSTNWWWTLDWTDPGFVDVFDDAWHILVLRQKADNTGMEFWIDGINVPCTTIAETDLSYGNDAWLTDIFGASSAHEYTVGKSSTGTSWPGEIAGFGVTDTAPSDAQIIQMALDFEFDVGAAQYSIKTRRNPNRYMVYDYT